MITVIRVAGRIDGLDRTFMDRWTGLFPLYFKPSLEYYLGLDQSTSRTGIYLRSKGREEYIQIEFPRNSLEMYEYELQLEEFLAKLIKGLKVKLVAMEKPVEFANRSANAPLQAFRKTVKNILRRILPDLKPIEMHPSVWKSNMGINPSKLAKQYKEKKIRNKKEEIAKTLVNKFPELKTMLLMSTKDYDSFDAVGILEAALLTNLGTEIRNTETLKTMLMLFTTSSNKGLAKIKTLPSRIFNEMDMKTCSEKLTLYEIAKKSSPSGPVVTQITSPSIRVAVQWILGKTLEADEIPIVIIAPKSYLKTEELRFIKAAFPTREYV